jgi:hypothetical protein
MASDADRIRPSDIIRNLADPRLERVRRARLAPDRVRPAGKMPSSFRQRPGLCVVCVLHAARYLIWYCDQPKDEPAIQQWLLQIVKQYNQLSDIIPSEFLRQYSLTHDAFDRTQAILQVIARVSAVQAQGSTLAHDREL